MKNTLLSVALILLSLTSHSQNLGDHYYTLDFDNGYAFDHLIIDTVLNHNNVWQVGTPHKTIFNSAYSSPNVIVTDTSNPYPSSDTSSFTILNVCDGMGWIMPHTAILSGRYNVNSDDFNDFGKIEISLDNGNIWIDLLNDYYYFTYYYWDGYPPTLTGNSNGWQSFDVRLEQLGPLFGIAIGDTILYRFTFISDSIQTTKDGLMFDDLHFEDWTEGIAQIGHETFPSSAYPNPVSDLVNIEFDNPEHDHYQLLIYDDVGRVLEKVEDLTNSSFVVNTTLFSPGIYSYKLWSNHSRKLSEGKFARE